MTNQAKPEDLSSSSCSTCAPLRSALAAAEAQLRRVVSERDEVRDLADHIEGDRLELEATLAAAEAGRQQLAAILDSWKWAYSDALDDRSKTAMFMRVAMPEYLNALQGFTLPALPRLPAVPALDPAVTLALWREQDEALQRIWGALGVDGSPACAGDVAEWVERALAETRGARLPAVPAQELRPEVQERQDDTRGDSVPVVGHGDLPRLNDGCSEG